jgi:HD-GYP domain-containing protein (c-di-GMP phosphodiesterase class II)
VRLIAIENATTEMKIAKNIYTADGRILLSIGVQLNGFYIQRLKELGISSLYIYDDKMGNVEVDELVYEHTKRDALKITKEIMTKIHQDQVFSTEKISQTINTIIDELVRSRKVVHSLVDIRSMNDYTFGHCVLVSVLSLKTGIDLGYDYRKLKALGEGAILHDAGKARISDEILNKPGPVTPEEYQEIQKHPQIGYEILKKCEGVSAVSAHIAWQHHEKYDGTGYPMGLKGNAIHEMARIVTIADIYDALSTDRIYRKRTLTHQVIEFLRDNGGKIFDPEIVKVFIKNIAPFPVGSIVILSTGETAVVTKVHRDFLTRPLVKVIFDGNGNPIREPIEKDLTTDLTTYIAKVEEAI